MILQVTLPTDVGSIQAWVAVIQVIIGALTAYFLIETFRLQLHTFNEQRKLAKMEAINFRIKNQPKLTVKESNTTKSVTGHDNLGVTLEISQGIAFDLVISHDIEGPPVFDASVPNYDRDHEFIPGEHIYLYYSFDKKKFKEEYYGVVFFQPQLTTTIDFKDILGNQYRTSLTIDDKLIVNMQPSKCIKKAAHL